MVKEPLYLCLLVGDHHLKAMGKVPSHINEQPANEEWRCMSRVNIKTIEKAAEMILSLASTKTSDFPSRAPT